MTGLSSHSLAGLSLLFTLYVVGRACFFVIVQRGLCNYHNVFSSCSEQRNFLSLTCMLLELHFSCMDGKNKIQSYVQSRAHITAAELQVQIQESFAVAHFFVNGRLFDQT